MGAVTAMAAAKDLGEEAETAGEEAGEGRVGKAAGVATEWVEAL